MICRRAARLAQSRPLGLVANRKIAQAVRSIMERVRIFVTPNMLSPESTNVENELEAGQGKGAPESYARIPFN